MFLGETSNWDAVKSVLPEGLTVVSLPGSDCDGPHITWESLLQEGAGSQPAYQGAPDDLVSLVFTSGTTGMPKGVIQTHESNLIPVRRGEEAFALRESPRFFSYLPLSHIAERQIVEYASLVEGGDVWFNESLETLTRICPCANPMCSSVHRGFGNNCSRRCWARSVARKPWTPCWNRTPRA